MSDFYETCEGPIKGLYLPAFAWEVLHRENIGTLDELRALGGQLERFNGVQFKTAQTIRFELDRVAIPGEKIFDEGQLSPWSS
jgi:hypothetical protein